MRPIFLGLGLETGGLGLGLGLDTCGLGLGLEGSVLNISQDRPCTWPSICFLFFYKLKSTACLLNAILSCKLDINQCL